MTIFVVCHNSLPNYRLPDGAVIMWMNAKPPVGTTDLDIIPGYDFFDRPEALHDKLAGSMGSLAIHRYLSGLAQRDRLLTIWQYRKFITKEVLGKRSPNFPGMNLTSVDDMASVNLTDPETLAHEYITAIPWKISSIAYQYLLSHNFIDFLRHTALAIESGVIDQKKTLDYMNEGQIVPGGMELGTYPVEWWLEAFDKVSRPSLIFAERYLPFNTNDPYQRRAIAFCQERLGSHVLVNRIKEIQAVNIEKRGIGVMHTVTAEGVYRGGRS